MDGKLKTPKFNNDGILDLKYFLWFFLMLGKALQETAFPNFGAIDYLLAGVWVFFWVTNISRPREMIMWFLMGYFTNIMHWFTDMALLGQGGARILMLDVFFVSFAGVFLVYILKARKVNRFFLGWVLLFLTLYWGLNMVKGFATGGGGYVIGESRFYFVSVLMIGIVNLFDKKPVKSYRKVVKIISLCSLNVMFFILMQVFFGAAEGGADAARFNPGNGLVQIPLMGLLIVVLDYTYGSDEHIIKGRKMLMIGIYLAFIFISGVRGALLMLGLMLVYFLVLSTKLSFTRKTIIITGMLLFGGFSLLFPPVQRVLQTQQEYVEIMMGEGDKHAKTTSDFRMEMWGVFWNKLTEEKTRMLFGRPFGLELIDISSFYWARREGNDFVDNSLAHNDFLAISMTNGLVFTGMFLLVLSIYVGKAFVTSSFVKEKSFSYVVLFFGWCLLFQIFQSGTNAEIKHFGWSISLWIYVGILGSLFNYLKIQRKQWLDQ